jgi:hypothetical protein
MDLDWTIPGDLALAALVVKAMSGKTNQTQSEVPVFKSNASSGEGGGLIRMSESGPKYGDKMPDGSVYAGISPDSGKAMYATPYDAPLTYTFNQAQKYAARLDAHGHMDWRVPTKGELNVLFQNRAAIGGFDESGSGPAGWYWSSSQLGHYSFDARAQRFSNGYQFDFDKFGGSSLRCVR